MVVLCEISMNQTQQIIALRQELKQRRNLTKDTLTGLLLDFVRESELLDLLFYCAQENLILLSRDRRKDGQVKKAISKICKQHWPNQASVLVDKTPALCQYLVGRQSYKASELAVLVAALEQTLDPDALFTTPSVPQQATQRKKTPVTRKPKQPTGQVSNRTFSTPYHNPQTPIHNPPTKRGLWNRINQRFDYWNQKGIDWIDRWEKRILDARRGQPQPYYVSPAQRKRQAPLYTGGDYISIGFVGFIIGGFIGGISVVWTNPIPMSFSDLGEMFLRRVGTGGLTVALLFMAVMLFLSVVKRNSRS